MGHPPTPEQWKLPDHTMDASNLSVIVGLGGAVASVSVIGVCLFLVGNGDAGLGWIGIASTLGLYGGAMALLWFASAAEAG
ncbi:MAG: hypothetical protein ABMA64_28810 [Myxococcota bacterium]